MRTWPSFPATTYRMYAEDGHLLYVGASGNFCQRLNDHEFGAKWLDVDHITVEHHDNMAAALRAEAAAIRAEEPEWNTAHSTPEIGLPREFTTYRTLRNFVEQHEYAPSLDELRVLLGLKSVSATKARLDTLENLGLIRRVGPRAIEFL